MHENFMMVQPIDAGTQQTKVKEKREVVWNGNAEKFNDTTLTSGKEGDLVVLEGRGRLEKYGTRSLQSI